MKQSQRISELEAQLKELHEDFELLHEHFLKLRKRVDSINKNHYQIIEIDADRY